MRTETFIQEKLTRMGQQALLSQLASLKSEDLAQDLASVDEELFQAQKSLLTKTQTMPTPCSPIAGFTSEPTEKHVQIGEELLSQGKCAALVVAGGLGSRLRLQGPKGCLPLSLVKQKSLYALLAEKTKAASKKYGRPLPLAIMTSPETHGETNVFFAQHGYFGCDPSQIFFFVQPSWPFLDFEGNLFLKSEEHLAMGPNGNGAALSEFVRVQLAKRFREFGVEYLHFHQIDNPLADPFDAALFGFCHEQKADVAIQAISRENPEENVGVLVQQDEKVQVIEYTELGEKERGNLRDYPLANVSIFCFTMDFVERAGLVNLPLHVAKKAVKTVGSQEIPKEPNGWKFEQYIFDALPLSQATKILVNRREDCFAPLKNFEGVDSIRSAQRALLKSDQKRFAKISGQKVNQDALFELAQEFYYPTEELKRKWNGKPLPKTPYIEGN